MNDREVDLNNRLASALERIETLEEEAEQAHRCIVEQRERIEKLYRELKDLKGKD